MGAWIAPRISCQGLFSWAKKRPYSGETCNLLSAQGWRSSGCQCGFSRSTRAKSPSRPRDRIFSTSSLERAMRSSASSAEPRKAPPLEIKPESRMTRLRARSNSAAQLAEISPPIECPTRWGLSRPRPVITAARSAADCPGPYSVSGWSASPCPRASGIITS